MLIGILMKKKLTLPKTFHFYVLQNIFFSSFVQKNWSINVESHMYKVSNQDGTYLRRNLWIYAEAPSNLVDN